MYKFSSNLSFIAMVRPAAFGYNRETAADNFFQHDSADSDSVQKQAEYEFDGMLNLLRGNNIRVLFLQDTPSPEKPDAIFPNNWFTCNNNTITVFPMSAENRRLEKNKDFIELIKDYTCVKNVDDWSDYEKENKFLEGTGSMVIDHVNSIVYACLSPRTNEELLNKFAAQNNYRTIVFHAADQQGREIYHTNVLMCIAKNFAVVCTDAVREDERAGVIDSLKSTGHEIIEISFEQMNAFAGNMLELKSGKERLLIMSKTANESLRDEQLDTIRKYCRIIAPDVSTIEKIGGGSVRCMMAELFFD